MKWVLAFVVIGMVFTGTACKKAPENAATSQKKLTIGVMPKLVGIDFFNACERGAKEAAKELNVELVFDGPITADATKQVEMLDTWITRKFDVIAVAPNDPHALSPTLKKAIQRGIKVLTWDADSDPDSRNYFVSQATYESVGYALVDVMAELIGGKGKVAVVTGSLTAANQNEWMVWMRKRIAEKYPTMEIVTVKPAEEDQQLAFQVATDLMKAYPDLSGIFGITSVALPGAAEAARQAGKSGKIVITGLSTPNIMRQYVKDTTVKEFVLWSPVDLGYLTVYAAKLLQEQGQLPEKFQAGRLGEISRLQTMILLGQPIRFNAQNIDQYQF